MEREQKPDTKTQWRVIPNVIEGITRHIKMIEFSSNGMTVLLLETPRTKLLFLK